jgi:hypothetical protein
MNDNIPYINLLCNNFKMQKPIYTPSDEETTKHKTLNDDSEETVRPKILKDDNEEIMLLLNERLQLGRKRYGHGVVVDQDTRKFGTPDNDWELMALEELLDGLIYTTAAIIRHRRQKQISTQEIISNNKVDDHDKPDMDYII